MCAIPDAKFRPGPSRRRRSRRSGRRQMTHPAAWADHSRIRGRLGVELPLTAFLERPTIEALARNIKAMRAGGTSSPEPAIAGAAPRSSQQRCSFAQERFWFIDQVSGGTAVTNVAWAVRL